MIPGTKASRKWSGALAKFWRARNQWSGAVTAGPGRAAAKGSYKRSQLTPVHCCHNFSDWLAASCYYCLLVAFVAFSWLAGVAFMNYHFAVTATVILVLNCPHGWHCFCQQQMLLILLPLASWLLPLWLSAFVFAGWLLVSWLSLPDDCCLSLSTEWLSLLLSAAAFCNCQLIVVTINASTACYCCNFATGWLVISCYSCC